MAARLRAEIRACQELLKEEMLTKMEIHHERIIARIDVQLEKIEACVGKAEATNLEASPEGIGSEAEHEEVPKEKTAVETSGALKKQYGVGI
jgi:cell division septum initiation protein DivIVA